VALLAELVSYASNTSVHSCIAGDRQTASAGKVIESYKIRFKSASVKAINTSDEACVRLVEVLGQYLSRSDFIYAVFSLARLLSLWNPLAAV
jgi:hypothetical protein